MNNSVNCYSELKILDAELAKLGSSDFICAMHEPASADRLSRTIDYLIENWPSVADARSFRNYIIESSGGSIHSDDSETLHRIASIGNRKVIPSYKAGQQTIIDKATLFINLYSHRPNTTRLYELYGQVADVESIAESIFKIKHSF